MKKILKINYLNIKKIAIIFFSFSIIISLLLAIFAAKFGYISKGDLFCGSTKQQEKNKTEQNNNTKANIKIEENKKLNKQEKVKNSIFTENIKFTKCDNLAKYKNREEYFKTDKNLNTIYDILKGNFRGEIIEYCRDGKSEKYIVVFDGFYGKKIYQYDVIKKIAYKSVVDGFFSKDSIKRFYKKNKYDIRNYGDDSLKIYLEKYIKSKEKIAGFGLKKKNIIPYSVYGGDLIGCAECAPGIFSGISQFFSEKTRKYCETGLTPKGKLSVCFADVFYEYDLEKNIIKEKRVCSYYIDDEGNKKTLEKCFDINYNKNGYILKGKTKGVDFFQDKTGDLSVIDIDLDSAGISFGGVKINKISDFDKFDKSYAKDFEYDYEKYNSYFLVNGQFFTNITKKNTALSFPVKSEGKIITDYMDNEIPKRTFVIDKNSNAKILEGYKKDFLENKNHKEVIVGFTPEVSARRGAEIGRTYIGIKSPKNVIFFIAKNKNQKQMNKIISDYGIKKENIIMMDGGPSSQFSYYENNGPGSEREQFYGKWKVPHFFIIYNK